MKKTVKYALLGGAVAALGVGLGALYRATVHRLMVTAMDRKELGEMGKSMERISGIEDLSGIAETVLSAAEALEKIETRRVELKAHDGVPLVGHWYCPENPKRVVVAMHGWRSSWTLDFGLISPFWRDEDCAVLYPDQRGQGESGGEYMGFGLLERYDCQAWAAWAEKETGGKLPIYLGGMSMGATTVLMAAGGELPKSVVGIVADCGFTSPHDIWKHVAENNLHVPYGIYSAAARDICKKKIRVASDSYSTVDAVQVCGVPVLFIHGTDDRFVPIEMTYENYKACTSKKRLFIVPGAEHGMSYLIDREGYEAAVLAFFSDCEGAREKED